MTNALASGTFAWSPGLSDLIIAAYGRCQIRRSALTPDHLRDAAFACNLLQVEWANEQINLWTVDQQTIPLEAGRYIYDIDPNTIMIMAAWISTGEMDIRVDGDNIHVDVPQPTVDAMTLPARNDRILTSIDRDTYASFPNKHGRGQPSVYWLDMQKGPRINLWEVPDSSQRYVLHFYRARNMQDANMASGVKADIPYRFTEAYVAALAFKCAELYAPARMDELIKRAAATFKSAADRDVEDAPLRIVPALSAYTSAVY